MNRLKMSLIDHLEELRWRIILCLITLVITAIISSVFTPRILEILKKPAGDSLKTLAFFGPTEAIWAYIKIALVSGLIISLPVILFQVWCFISPALEERERRTIASFLWLIILFFIGGLIFAYYVLLPFALKFLLTFASSQLVPLISIDKYLSFVFILLLGCGLVFEMPVAVLTLSRLNIITSSTLRRHRKIAVLLIFIIAGVITPTPDAFNMILMAVPMLLLYEISIALAFISEKKRKRIECKLQP